MVFLLGGSNQTIARRGSVSCFYAQRPGIGVGRIVRTGQQVIGGGQLPLIREIGGGNGGLGCTADAAEGVVGKCSSGDNGKICGTGGVVIVMETVWCDKVGVGAA